MLLSAMNSTASVTERKPTRAADCLCNGIIDECASGFYSFSIDEIRCLNHDTLARLLSSDSLVVESEDWLLQLLIDLELNRSEFFCFLEISLLSSTSLSLFIDSMTFDHLTESLWLKIASCFQGHSSPDLVVRRCRGRIDSTIVKEIPAILREFSGKQWGLLYRGSRDGFRGASFHSKCDGQSNTVTIIETTKGYKFGGFKPVAWESPGRYYEDTSGKSFLFTVKSPRGMKGGNSPSRPRPVPSLATCWSPMNVMPTRIATQTLELGIEMTLALTGPRFSPENAYSQ
jgi:hypothetical protein